MSSVWVWVWTSGALWVGRFHLVAAAVVVTLVAVGAVRECRDRRRRRGVADSLALIAGLDGRSVGRVVARHGANDG